MTRADDIAADFEQQRKQAAATRWLALPEHEQMTLTFNADGSGKSITAPAPVIHEMVRYGNRARTILGKERGALATWTAMTWLVTKVYSGTFYRPQYLTWVNLFVEGATLDAESYFWDAVFTADDVSGDGQYSTLFSTDRIKLISGDWETVDEWGVVPNGNPNV